MITIHHFNEACQHYKQDKITFRILQDQAAVMLGLCQHPHPSVSSPLEISETDIDWLTQQPEANYDYSEYLGGYIYVCEVEEDLLQIKGCDFEWAELHGGWPNVIDNAMFWDVCNYLDEASGDPQWVIFLLCWNNAGGPVYYVPKHLWLKARVTEHIESTKPTINN